MNAFSHIDREHRPPPSSTIDSTPDPVKLFFYDGTRYFLDTGKEFIPMDQRSVSRHLRGMGFTSRDEIDGVLCEIQVTSFINYGGPLAGLDRGLHESGGSKLLATNSPAIIKPSPGSWPTLKAVIDGLLDDEEFPEQTAIFLAWLKFARESLVAGLRRPGQALALSGPRNCGKSLLIDIIEAAMGGRRANPYNAFTGRTNFNGDLAGAELLAVDDEAGSTDIRARKNLAANIKSHLFAGSVRIEAKHKTGFVFRPVWRMVLALNDEPEALLALPPITEDIADKITLLHCYRRPLPMPAHTMGEREAFFRTLIEELPAMLHWLDRWSVPDHLGEERCGVVAFHHPALLASLLELSPEGQLIGLIDTAARAGGIALPWEGVAADLKALLVQCTVTSRDADKLLGGWHAATGAYLARLTGERVEKLTVRDGVQRWRILPSG